MRRAPLRPHHRRDGSPPHGVSRAGRQVTPPPGPGPGRRPAHPRARGPNGTVKQAARSPAPPWRSWMITDRAPPPGTPSPARLRAPVTVLVGAEVEPHLVDRIGGRRRAVLVVGPGGGGIGAARRGVHVHPVGAAGHEPPQPGFHPGAGRIRELRDLDACARRHQPGVVRQRVGRHERSGRREHPGGPRPRTPAGGDGIVPPARVSAPPAPKVDVAPTGAPCAPWPVAAPNPPPSPAPWATPPPQASIARATAPTSTPGTRRAPPPPGTREAPRSRAEAPPSRSAFHCSKAGCAGPVSVRSIHAVIRCSSSVPECSPRLTGTRPQGVRDLDNINRPGEGRGTLTRTL